MKSAIIIPAYNAGATLLSVIDRIPPETFKSLTGVWIVNDGSTDETGAEADRLARGDPRVHAIHAEQNSGYGAAVKLGLTAAVSADVEIFVCVHADGQYAPEELPGILRAMHTEKLDLLQGSRIASGTALSGGMPIYKYVAGSALTFLENRVFGLRMTDYHSGYLAYSRRSLSLIDFCSLSDSFHFDLEMIASARALGLVIGEIPVPTHYGDEVSYLSPVRYGFSVLRVMFNYVRRQYHPPVGVG